MWKVDEWGYACSLSDFKKELRERIRRRHKVADLWKTKSSQSKTGYTEVVYTRQNRSLMVRIYDEIENEPQERRIKLAWEIWAFLNYRFEVPPPGGDDSIVIVCRRGQDYAYVGEEIAR